MQRVPGTFDIIIYWSPVHVDFVLEVAGVGPYTQEVQCTKSKFLYKGLRVAIQLHTIFA